MISSEMSAKSVSYAKIALATKKTAAAPAIMSSMAIFNDPTYIIIGIIGAFVSMGSAYYDVTLMKKERELAGKECTKVLHIELGKAFVLGSIVTILSFMLFTGITKDGYQKLGISWLDNMMPSFWFIVTIAISTESTLIWNWFKKKLKGVLNGDTNRE